jgi:hypothetical protein
MRRLHVILNLEKKNEKTPCDFEFEKKIKKIEKTACDFEFGKTKFSACSDRRRTLGLGLGCVVFRLRFRFRV